MTAFPLSRSATNRQVPGSTLLSVIVELFPLVTKELFGAERIVGYRYLGNFFSSSVATS